MHKKIAWLLLFISGIVGCKTVKQGLFSKQSPHEAYHSKLSDSGLDSNIIGREWIQASNHAFSQAVTVEIPYTEALVFNYMNFQSASYRLNLKEGQNVHILVEPEFTDSTEIFIDLFRFINDEFRQAAFADKDSLRLDYRVNRSDEYILRIQPELMAQGLYTVYIFTDASLNFPVPGKDFNSISSFFGDPRDGNSRRHEGIDIFAPRGTPALAVGSGRVTRTGTNRLGGKVVWVSDSQRGYNYYYAHLDSQLVRPGMQVMEGDTVGLIGNTGNAITTPPHLHFGIYAFGRRSIDPSVFFHRSEMPAIDSSYINLYADQWVKTTAPRTNFRNAPGMDAEVTNTLPRDTPVKINGITNNWLRAELPEGEHGYIYQTLVTPATEAVEKIIAGGKIIRVRPDHNAVAKRATGKDETVDVIAEYNSFLLIDSDGHYGWIDGGS